MEEFKGTRMPGLENLDEIPFPEELPTPREIRRREREERRVAREKRLAERQEKVARSARDLKEAMAKRESASAKVGKTASRSRVKLLHDRLTRHRGGDDRPRTRRASHDLDELGTRGGWRLRRVTGWYGQVAFEATRRGKTLVAGTKGALIRKIRERG